MSRLLQLTTFALLMIFNIACAEDELAESQAEGRVVEEGRDFVRVVPAQPTGAAPGQIEVLEFF